MINAPSVTHSVVFGSDLNPEFFLFMFDKFKAVIALQFLPIDEFLSLIFYVYFTNFSRLLTSFIVAYDAMSVC